MYVCMYVCILIYIYTYIHTYIDFIYICYTHEFALYGTGWSLKFAHHDTVLYNL